MNKHRKGPQIKNISFHKRKWRLQKPPRFKWKYLHYSVMESSQMFLEGFILPVKTICCMSMDVESLCIIMDRKNRNWFHWQIKENISLPLVSTYKLLENRLMSLKNVKSIWWFRLLSFIINFRCKQKSKAGGFCWTRWTSSCCSLWFGIKKKEDGFKV